MKRYVGVYIVQVTYGIYAHYVYMLRMYEWCDTHIMYAFTCCMYVM